MGNLFCNNSLKLLINLPVTTTTKIYVYYRGVAKVTQVKKAHSFWSIKSIWLLSSQLYFLPNPTKPSQTQPNPTKPSQTQPNPAKPNQTQPIPTKTLSNPTKPNQAQPKPYQTQPSPTKTNHTQSNPAKPSQISRTTANRVKSEVRSLSLNIIYSKNLFQNARALGTLFLFK